MLFKLSELTTKALAELLQDLRGAQSAAGRALALDVQDELEHRAEALVWQQQQAQDQEAFFTAQEALAGEGPAHCPWAFEEDHATPEDAWAQACCDAGLEADGRTPVAGGA